MATEKEIQKSIDEHQSKLNEIQEQFDNLAHEIAEGELNGKKNLDELKEQQFNLRQDIRNEEQTLEYLAQALESAKRDDAIAQYRDFLKQHREKSQYRKSLNEQIDKLKQQLKPLEAELEQSWQSYTWLGGRVDDLRKRLPRDFGVDIEQVDKIRNEILGVTQKT